MIEEIKSIVEKSADKKNALKVIIDVLERYLTENGIEVKYDS